MILEIDTGAGFVPVSCLTQVSQSDTAKVLGTTTRQNNGWRSSRPVQNDMTISGTGIIPLDLGLFRYQDLVELKRSRTIFAWRIGDEVGAGLLVEISAVDTQGEDTAFDFTIQNTGQVVTGPPEGYSVNWLATEIISSNQSGIFFLILGGEPGQSFTYEITSTGGGGPINGSGFIFSSAQSVGPLDVSGLGNGDVTVALTLTNPAGPGPTVSDTVPKNAVPAPSGYSVEWITLTINPSNETAAQFEVLGGTAGDQYDYTIYSSGGGAPVSGSGTLATGDQTFTVNLSGLNTGTVTVEVELTNAGGTGPTVSDTALKEAAAPSGYSVAWLNDPINDNTPPFTISGGANIGAFIIGGVVTSSGGGSPIILPNSTINTDPQQFMVDVSSLPNGTLTISLQLKYSDSPVGPNVQDTTTKNT